LDSLKVTKEGPNEMHGIPFDYPIYEVLTEDVEPWQLQEYLIARIDRAESNAKPETLLEDVKAAVRAGMDAEQGKMCNENLFSAEADKIRRLSDAGEP
jgi:uncharacterized NAD-dependent epimerase/dehydratase family protein